MNLAWFHSATDFRARAERFLAAHEAQHNLLLGLSRRLMVNPNLYSSQPYFVVVEDGVAVVAAAVMTPPYRLVLSLTQEREALRLIAQDVYMHYPILPGVIGPVPISLHFAEIWRDLTGQPFRKGVAQRLYQLTNVNPVSDVPGHMRRATEADRALLKNWWLAFQEDASGEADVAAVERNVNDVLTAPPGIQGVYLWEDGRPVSMAGYGGPTPNGIRIGPVYTPPKFRRQGYANACV